MSNYIPNNEHFLKRARNIRNELLNRTDRYFLIDYPDFQWTKPPMGGTQQ